MIRDRLIAALKERFPGVAFEFRDGEVVASLESPHPEAGPLAICDGGDEVIVFVDPTVHMHFGCYQDGLTSDQKESKIVGDVLAFIGDLLADRVVIQRLGSGWAGGVKKLEIGKEPSPSWFWKQSLWSRTLEKKKANQASQPTPLKRRG